MTIEEVLAAAVAAKEYKKIEELLRTGRVSPNMDVEYFFQRQQCAKGRPEGQSYYVYYTGYTGVLAEQFKLTNLEVGREKFPFISFAYRLKDIDLCTILLRYGVKNVDQTLFKAEEVKTNDCFRLFLDYGLYQPRADINIASGFGDEVLSYFSFTRKPFTSMPAPLEDALSTKNIASIELNVGNELIALTSVCLIERHAAMKLELLKTQPAWNRLKHFIDDDDETLEIVAANTGLFASREELEDQLSKIEATVLVDNVDRYGRKDTSPLSVWYKKALMERGAIVDWEGLNQQTNEYLGRETLSHAERKYARRIIYGWEEILDVWQKGTMKSRETKWGINQLAKKVLQKYSRNTEHFPNIVALFERAQEEILGRLFDHWQAGKLQQDKSMQAFDAAIKELFNRIQHLKHAPNAVVKKQIEANIATIPGAAGAAASPPPLPNQLVAKALLEHLEGKAAALPSAPALIARFQQIVAQLMQGKLVLDMRPLYLPAATRLIDDWRAGQGGITPAEIRDLQMIEKRLRSEQPTVGALEEQLAPQVGAAVKMLYEQFQKGGLGAACTAALKSYLLDALTKEPPPVLLDMTAAKLIRYFARQQAVEEALQKEWRAIQKEVMMPFHEKVAVLKSRLDVVPRSEFEQLKAEHLKLLQEMRAIKARIGIEDELSMPAAPRGDGGGGGAAAGCSMRLFY